MDDDLQGLDIQGTDKYDEWWELEHQDEDVDDTLEDDYSENDYE